MPLSPDISATIERSSVHGNSQPNSNSSAFDLGLVNTDPAQHLSTEVTPMPILTEFEEVSAHTAKCDLCNNRNDKGMTRCKTCGWQSCHPCTIAHGCRRTHNAGGRMHVGPIEQNKLVFKKQRKSSATATATATSSRFDAAVKKRKPNQLRRKLALKPRIDAVATTTTLPPIPTVASSSRVGRDDKKISKKKEPTPTSEEDGVAETESVLNGAKGLYALCVEAYATLAQADRERNISDNKPDDRANDNTGVLRDAMNIHNMALNQAEVALGVHKMRKFKGQTLKEQPTSPNVENQNSQKRASRRLQKRKTPEPSALSLGKGKGKAPMENLSDSEETESTIDVNAGVNTDEDKDDENGNDDDDDDAFGEGDEETEYMEEDEEDDQNASLTKARAYSRRRSGN